MRMETQSNTQSGEDKSWFVSAVISSSLHNDLNTYSAATPRGKLPTQFSETVMQIRSALTRQTEGSAEPRGLQSIRPRQIGFSAAGLCVCVCALLGELSDLFPEKRPVPGRFN